MFPSRRSVVLMAIAGCAAVSLPALGQGSYPAKPVTVVVSYPPGGDTDAIARLFAEKLGQAVAPVLNPLLRGSWSRYQALPAETVASAILALAGAPGGGRFVHENDGLRALAGA